MCWCDSFCTSESQSTDETGIGTSSPPPDSHFLGLAGASSRGMPCSDRSRSLPLRIQAMIPNPGHDAVPPEVLDGHARDATKGRTGIPPPACGSRSSGGSAVASNPQGNCGVAVVPIQGLGVSRQGRRQTGPEDSKCVLLVVPPLCPSGARGGRVAGRGTAPVAEADAFISSVPANHHDVR